METKSRKGRKKGGQSIPMGFQIAFHLLPSRTSGVSSKSLESSAQHAIFRVIKDGFEPSPMRERGAAGWVMPSLSQALPRGRGSVHEVSAMPARCSIPRVAGSPGGSSLYTRGLF